MWKEGFILLCATILLAGCTTIDLEKQTVSGRGISKKEPKEKVVLKSPEELAVEETRADIAPQIVFIEKPVFIPERTAGNSTAQLLGYDSVVKSNKSGTLQPKDYSHAARIYDYNPDQVYEVYCQPLRTTDFYLEAEEKIIDIPFISDSERWILGGGTNQAGDKVVSHIYIKPKEAALSASLIINTTKRVYHILLRSYENVYMPMVRFNYKLEEAEKTGVNAFNNIQAIRPVEISTSAEIVPVDPRYLSFDYIVRFPLFKKPSWLPRLVYDDGRKTYIVFNKDVLQKEIPGVFENSKDIINYRVNNDVIIIDKLTKKTTVRFKDESITVEKKVR
ncbi:hypothetical protein FACS1894190_16630 [Spirochaetia bacterium]|nr:hypothetical protein FACS1894190_16630 [Spirochaetia bacterium]